MSKPLGNEPTALSGALRLGVAVGYAGLLAVNGIYGSGAFGVRTNAEMSGAYPSAVTPAGFTFAIWGPIFLLQAGGTLLMAAGQAKTLGAAAAVPWLCAWASECLWQLCFGVAPMNAAGEAAGTPAERLAVLVPCFFFLAAAQASMLCAARHISDVAGDAGAAEQIFVALPTGLNAAWLAAATGIGLSLVAKIVFPPLSGPAGGAGLLSFVLLAASGVVPYLVPRNRALALGYAAATCWACHGMRFGNAPGEVKTVATYGGCVVAAVTLASLVHHYAFAPSAPPPSSPEASPAKSLI